MSSRRTAAVGAVAGIVAAAGESLRPSLTPRSTLHQALVTGVMASTGAALGAVSGAAVGRIAGRRGGAPWLPVGLLAGASAAAVTLAPRHIRAQRVSYAEWGRQDGNPAVGAAAGAVLAAGLTATAGAAGWQVGRGTSIASQRFGGHPLLWTAGGAALVGGTLVLGGRIVFLRTLASLEDEGRAADRALKEPIGDANVTGGPGSAVDYNTLSREGRRFVHWRVSAHDLAEAGFGGDQESVRVFVGLDSAVSAPARVDLAMAELERLGAFDKGHLLAVCPAGSGYANSVPVEALECYTRGDCASVVVQYGVLPSMLSRDKVPEAADTFRLLIDRIRRRIDSTTGAARPRLHLYGESLGAEIAQTALTRSPDLVDWDAAAIRGVDSVLFVGTPGGTALRDSLRDSPRIVHVDRWQELPAAAPQGCQFWFLDHDADPVTRFETPLVHRQPGWLDGQGRGRNIPEQMRWVPVATWQQVLLDVAYATQAQSGVFRSVGHDYRADLAHLVAAAFDPQPVAQIERVQELLSEREVVRDRMLAAAEDS